MGFNSRFKGLKHKNFTYRFVCVWNLTAILSAWVRVSSYVFGNRDNFVWTPSLHICSNIHLSPPPSSGQCCNYFHPVTAAVSLLPQRELYAHYSPPGCHSTQFVLHLNYWWQVSEQTHQHSARSWKENRIAKNPQNINDTINQKATKIQAAQLCLKLKVVHLIT